ncbi:MAG: 50S ribosomal protein L30 [bacterium]
MTEKKQLKITLKKSLIGTSESQKKIAQSLGISKINQSVIHNDVPTIKGMINKIPHLLKVEELNLA